MTSQTTTFSFSQQTLLTKQINLGRIKITRGKTKLFLYTEKKSQKTINNINLLLEKLDIGSLQFEIHSFINGPKKFSGIVSLQSSNLKVSTSPKEQNFDFRNFDIFITDFNSYSPDAIQNISFDTLAISSNKKTVQVISLWLNLNHNVDSLLKVKHKSLVYNIYTPLLELKGLDIKQALYRKSIILDSLVLYNPTLDLYSYPEIASDTFNIQIRKIIREQTAKKLVNLTSQTIFDMYQTIKSFSDSIYRDFKHRSDLIDSIENFALDMIFNIHIPNSHINIEDTTAKNINQIYLITAKAINDIARGSSPDSSFFTAYSKLLHVKQLSEKKFINLNELATTLMTNLNLIQVNNVALNNAALTLKQKFSDKQTTIFNNLITINLTNFYLDKQFNTTCKDRLLCSDNIRVDINKYRLNLPDSVHTLEFNHLDINTNDSTIIISDVYINADTTRLEAKQTPAYINSYIPNIILGQISIHKLLDSNILDVQSILINKSFVHLLLKTNSREKTTQKSKTTQNPINKVIIHRIIAPKNTFRINNDQLDAYTIVDFYSNEITFDSLSTFTQLLDNVFARAVFKDTKLKLPSGPEIIGQSLYLDTKGKIWSKNVSVNMSDTIKLSWDSLFISELDLLNFLKSKQLNIKYLFINKPTIFSLTNAKRTAKPITEFELYPFIENTLSSITIDTSTINNIQINSPSTNLQNIFVQVKKFHIDSTSKIDTPGLFYCQNISLEVRNFKKQVSLLYTMGFDKLKADLSNDNITLDNFYYRPTVSVQKFSQLIQWRKTYTDFSARTLEIKNIDWIKLLNQEAVSASIIKLKDYYLYAYIDRSIKHDYSNIKPHFVDLILKSRIPLDIHDVILQNGDIVYEEKAPDNSKPGHIELNNTYLVLSNVMTNLKPPGQIRLHLSGYIQNKSKISIYGYFDPDTVKYKFRMYGNLGNMHLADLNPFLVYSANIKVNSGYLEKAEFLINGSDSIATGVFKATYHDLIIEVLKPGGEIQPQKRKFLTFAANLIARRNNPKLGVFYKIGYIAYVHDRSFSDIKFWIKALISGTKSLILFENKKELKKIYRLKYGSSVMFYL